jgi:hypothetical protein
MEKMLARGFVFLAIFASASMPSMRLVEMLLTSNISSGPPLYFPVLARSSPGNFLAICCGTIRQSCRISRSVPVGAGLAPPALLSLEIASHPNLFYS